MNVDIETPNTLYLIDYYSIYLSHLSCGIREYYKKPLRNPDPVYSLNEGIRKITSEDSEPS